jgi:hypothetical protein
MQGVNVTPGLFPITGSGELVVNYNTGEVSLFLAGGVAAAPLPSANAQQGFIFNLPTNKDYSGGFTGVSGSFPLPVP